MPHGHDRKCGETSDLLHPADEVGRLTLVHRFGARGIAAGLPPLLVVVAASAKTVLCCCDPLHGNTETTASGRKTRRFDDILAELEQAFELHAAHGTRLGGARGLAAAELERDYRSHVDPRPHYEQSLEMAMRVAARMSAG